MIATAKNFPYWTKVQYRNAKIICIVMSDRSLPLNSKQPGAGARANA